jgi:hypothetical protein
MEQDKNRNKGATVTKPIELKPKNRANAPIAGRQDKPQSSDHKAPPGQDGHGAASVSVLPASRNRKSAPKPEIVEQIGHRLSSVYNSVLSQPIPDRFLDLLQTLETGETQPSVGIMAKSKEQK